MIRDQWRAESPLETDRLNQGKADTQRDGQGKCIDKTPTENENGPEVEIHRVRDRERERERNRRQVKRPDTHTLHKTGAERGSECRDSRRAGPGSGPRARRQQATWVVVLYSSNVLARLSAWRVR